MLLRKYICTDQLLQRFREIHRKIPTLEGRERMSETLTYQQEDVTETPEKDKRLGRSTASGVLRIHRFSLCCFFPSPHSRSLFLANRI